jgi:hypothetical protein
VYLGVRDKHDLESWGGRLNDCGHDVITFREPDRDNEITAIAVCGAEKELKNLRLL